MCAHTAPAQHGANCLIHIFLIRCWVKGWPGGPGAAPGRARQPHGEHDPYPYIDLARERRTPACPRALARSPRPRPLSTAPRPAARPSISHHRRCSPPRTTLRETVSTTMSTTRRLSYMYRICHSYPYWLPTPLSGATEDRVSALRLRVGCWVGFAAVDLRRRRSNERMRRDGRRSRGP